MLARIFWFVVAVGVGWYAWRRLRAAEELPMAPYTPSEPWVPPEAPPAARPEPPAPAPASEPSAPASAPEPPASEGEGGASGAAEPEPQPEGYCSRCKARRQLVDARLETTATGRRGMRGTCAVCGANVFTFVAKDS